MTDGWRICRAPFADLSGEGARLFGGRWNRPGLPMVYMAETAALAVLEVRVHLDLPPELMPDDYVLMQIDLNGLPMEECGSFPKDCQDIGDAWLRAQHTPILKVPSVIVPENANLLLNPRHPDATKARILSTRAFSLDRRLWPR
ncbi:RES family NAD+ phosphorylase [Niveispirillum irakense]|uniref:RES family NAD+ phosphorylase n=1 Tax=Niveispirillum irakense TaxID=34011 RepID=UPI00041F9D3E|nr:RES family NAD+ phosphorylase [Niveispirillum irakense]